MAAEEKIIWVDHLSKQFNGRYAVKEVSLEIMRGEIFGFLGPNGSGKTTTIRMLCGLLTPNAGRGTCLGHNILREPQKIKRLIGYVPQYFGLYKQLTVYENLVFIAGVYGLPDRHHHIERVMDQLELKARRNQLAGTLSGGWKQRLSLASAVLHGPTILFLDEPTASVDPSYRREFWSIVRDFSNKGITILLSSQNMDEAELCDRIGYFSNGILLTYGKTQQLITDFHLHIWQVKGEGLRLLAKKLEGRPGIELIMTFYDTLHVGGQNPQTLREAIYSELGDSSYQWQPIDTCLEDIFVWLSRKHKYTELME